MKYELRNFAVATLVENQNGYYPKFSRRRTKHEFDESPRVPKVPVGYRANTGLENRQYRSYANLANKNDNNNNNNSMSGEILSSRQPENIYNEIYDDIINVYKNIYNNLNYVEFNDSVESRGLIIRPDRITIDQNLLDQEISLNPALQLDTFIVYQTVISQIQNRIILAAFFQFI